MSRVQNIIAAAGLTANQAIVLSKPSNIFYASGYTGEGIAVIGHAIKCIVTDFRYTEQAEQQAPGFDVRMIESGITHAKLAYQVLKAAGIEEVLYEDDEVTVKAFEAMKAAMAGIAFLPLNGAPEKVRRIKDEGELSLIGQACAISCRAFDYICGYIREGMTEKEIQLALDYQMLALGADGLAFSTILASGENGSLPHAIPTDRKVQKGDMITMDFGAKKGGYCADMTRTVALGQPSAEMKKVYDVVLKAQIASEEAILPGKICSDIDKIARDIIDNAGYKGRFGHGLGHAVGIDIHENPRFSMLCPDVIEVGHVMTVEPGIYLPGIGGVRIENTCVVTENGAKTLVYAQKELLIL